MYKLFDHLETCNKYVENYCDTRNNIRLQYAAAEADSRHSELQI